MTHSEFMRRALGHQRKEEMIWHRWRLGICAQLNPHQKEGQRSTPKDIIELPMDRGEVNGLTQADIEGLKKFMNNG